VLNPYDPCVANCITKGKQCRIVWYVDDTKISHADPTVDNEGIGIIEQRFDKMTITRGTTHVFLGMHISFNGKGTMTIDMQEYIKEAIVDFGEDVLRPDLSPAKKNLLMVDEQSALLETAAKELFHSLVQKLLYMSHRGWSDIQPTLAVLCTRVSQSTKQDWKKLKRLLQYLHESIDLNLTLRADKLSTMIMWVDASYAVHEDMKSHTGGATSFSQVAIMLKSLKQKLNTKS
jgi:hypothetical protein